MDTVSSMVYDLNYVASDVEKAVSQYTDTALAQTLEGAEEESDRSAHDAFSVLIGWQDYVLTLLPVMLNQIDNPIPPINVEDRNRRNIAARENLTGKELLAEFQENHLQLIDILQNTTPELLLMRRTRNEQIFTVKSYLLDGLILRMREFADQMALLP